MLNENLLSAIASKHGFVRKTSERSRPEEIAGIVFSAAETMGGAFAMGYLNGRFQSPKKDHLQVFGLPADLTVGALGIVTSVMGIYGPLSSHVASLSAGAAAAYFARTGLTYGADARTTAAHKLVEQVVPAPLPSPSNVVSLTEKPRTQQVSVVEATAATK